MTREYLVLWVSANDLLFGTITAREQPRLVYSRGYAASREQAMRYFKARYVGPSKLTHSLVSIARFIFKAVIVTTQTDVCFVP